MRIRKFLYILLLVSISSCGLFQRTDPTLREFLPRDTDVPGWIKNNTYRTIDEKKIKEINDNYSVYNVVEYTAANYQSISEGKGQMTIVLLKCDSRLSAFGLFSIERKEDETRHLKDFSFFSDKGYFFVIGEYYIKLNCNNLEDKLKEDLIMFRGVFQDSVEGYADKDGLPEIAYNLSEDNNLKNLTYYRNGIALLPGTMELYMRDLDINNQKISVFYMKNKSAYEAIRQYLGILRINKEFIMTKAGNVQMAFKRIPENEYLFITAQKEYFVGILNSKSIDSGKKILITVLNKMP